MGNSLDRQLAHDSSETFSPQQGRAGQAAAHSKRGLHQSRHPLCGFFCRLQKRVRSSRAILLFDHLLAHVSCVARSVFMLFSASSFSFLCFVPLVAAAFSILERFRKLYRVRPFFFVDIPTTFSSPEFMSVFAGWACRWPAAEPKHESRQRFRFSFQC